MLDYLNIIPKSDCTGCGSCSAICPRSCISMIEDDHGFQMPMVDTDRCIHCGLCEKACPVLNSDGATEDRLPIKVFAAKNKNSHVAAQSSSGGVFSACAEYVLERNGVVYGVAINPGLKAEHIRIDTVDDLSQIQSSKYVQSNAANAYPLVKADIVDGKEVLFSGTPCQVAALRQYLRKDYPNLICIEIICHGVPSNLVFRKYVEFIQAKHRHRVISVNFRDKSKGWQDYHITFTFENGKKFSQKSSDNLYSQGYVNNLFVRESCTDCKFKGLRSRADITLGDMWGIESVIPSYDTANGVSMISVNTPAGKGIFAGITADIKDCAEVSYNDVKLHNPCIYRSVTAHKDRRYVLDGIICLPVNVLIKRALGINSRTIARKRYMQIKAYVINSLVVVKHRLFK